MKRKKYILAFLSAMACCVIGNSVNAVCSEATVSNYSREAAVFYNNARFQEAIRAYKIIAERGDSEGYLNLAVIFKDLGHYEKAIGILNKAATKFTGDLRVLSLLGRLYYLNNQTDKAIDVLKKILELYPDDLNTNITLGLCYEDKRDYTQAQRYLKKAIALNTNSVVARLCLADVYYRKEKFSEAVNEYTAVDLIDAGIIRIKKILGEIFLRTENLQDALKIYQKIKLLDSSDTFAQRRIDEISKKLGREYFEREETKRLFARRQKILLVRPFLGHTHGPFVRIGLIHRPGPVEFKSSSQFEIRTKAGEIKILSGAEQETYRVMKNSEGRIIISNQNKENIIVDEPVIVVPLKPEGVITLLSVALSQPDGSYRGAMEIAADKAGIRVVNLLSLEEYLYSVVPSEMPSGWPKEALKAQAVAARSKAMANLGRHRNEGFDFCPEVHCQSYRGVEQETALTNKVIDETRGVILTYDKKPVDAVYSSNCGGHTQNDIFGESPFLKPVVDSLNENDVTFPLSPFGLESWLTQPPDGILCGSSEYAKNDNFRWVRIYTVEEINAILKKRADFGEVIKIIVLKRQESGHISALKIIGTKGTYILEKELTIRKALGNLRSSMFKIEIKYSCDKKPDAFIFFGGGWGHGAGMCQTGAYGLALSGKNYKEIVHHYFRKVEFKKAY